MQRHPWAILTAWTALWSVAHLSAHSWSWHFLVTGVKALFSPRALHLYADHPELQMGPLTFLFGAPFVLALPGAAGEAAGMVFMAAIGLLILRELRTLAGPRARPRWFLIALLFVPAWAELAVRWGHLDDALALLCIVVGLRLVRTSHPFAAAVLLALSVNFKPWAAPFAALLFLAPRRSWPLLAAVWIAVVGLAWVPFLMGDPGMTAALRFAIPIDAASTLHFGPFGDQTPSWDRYAQIGIGFALAGIAVWRQRWPATILIVIAVRLLLDPATKNYYDVGLVLGAGVLDAVAATGLLPLLTIGAFGLVYLPSYLLAQFPEARGVVRTVALLGLLMAAFLVPRTPVRNWRYATRRDTRFGRSPRRAPG